MSGEFIIYHSPSDTFVSEFRGIFKTSEFPEDYQVFDSELQAMEAVEQISRENHFPESDFSIEEL